MLCTLFILLNDTPFVNKETYIFTHLLLKQKQGLHKYIH